MNWLFWGLFLVLTTGTSGGNLVSVTTGPYTKVTISRISESPNCSVCVGEGSSQACDSESVIPELQNTQVNFTCSRPQDIFTVKINRDFDCSSQCDYNTIHSDWPFFQDFNRTFTWDMRVSSFTKSFQIEFPSPGMRPIHSLEQCSDEQTFSLLMYVRAGPVNLGTFCQNGTITRIQMLWKGRLTVEVPGETTLKPFSFKYSEASGSVLTVDAVLPRGQSNTNFLSASGMPPDYTMMWNIVVPPKHNFTVNFLNYSEPQCESKSAKVLYEQSNKALVEKTLTDIQPANYQGSFNLSLINCDVRSAGASSGHEPLLIFSVSVFRSGFPDICTVDLQNDEGLSLQIERKNLDPFCEVAMDSVVQKKIVVPGGSKVKLSFLDCPESELVLTATKTIECQNFSSCPVAGTPLSTPFLDFCLPPSLSQMTWVVNAPEQAAVSLIASQGRLFQSVPGVQECVSSSVMVSAANGVNIGRFCSADNGTIQKVQFSSNITITIADGQKYLKQAKSPLFNVSFSSEIKESLIYTVSPLISTPIRLPTPNWPGPMKPDSTLSWIVHVPEGYTAQLNFTNVSRPTCHKSHAEVKIQELNSKKEWAFREDETLYLDKWLKSFYLNMSNCEPEKGKLAIVTLILLQKDPGNVLSVILGVVGALLALLIILAVICVLARKKKQRKGRSSSSIYFPRGAATLPGDASFPKTRVDNESHVYTSIDDTLAYGHLLNQDGNGSGQFPGHQVDSYHTFTGPMEKTVKVEHEDLERGPFLAPSETFIPSRPRTPLGPLDSMDYEDRRMVDNVLHTFKNTTNLNPLRLSAAEAIALPEPESNSESDQVYDQAM